MKLLYIAGRWDPTIQNEYSGSDFGAFRMLQNQPDLEIFLVGPLKDEPSFVEQLAMRGFKKLTKKD